MLFIVLMLLTSKTDYVWIAVAAIFIALVVTAYFFCCKLKDAFMKREEEKRLQKNENAEKICAICEKLLHNNSANMKEFKESLSAYISLLSSDMGKFLDKINGETVSIEGFVTQLASEQNEFVEYSRRMSESYNEKIDRLISELGKGIDSINSNYADVMEEMSQKHAAQIEQWSTSTEALAANMQNAIHATICNVDEHLTAQLDKSSRVIEEGVKNSKESIASLVDETKNMLLEHYQMLDELNHSTISGIRGLLVEKLNSLMEQERSAGDKLNANMDRYCRQLSESVIGFTNENISKMIVSCETVLNRSLNQIIEVNENTNEERSEAFGHYMNELENVYNETIEKHIKALKEQIYNSILEFSSENRQALDKNIELADGLISTEKEFISELEENNMKLRETIQNAFEEYSKSVERNITEFKNEVTGNISENANSTKSCIRDFEGKNEETIEMLAEKLRNYSDSFIDKSAQAIANVQADNNAKLQELCGRVSAYAQENSDFITHCREVNDAVGNHIHDMIQDRDELINDMKVISGEHIEGLETALKSNIMDMNRMLQEVNTKNSDRFHETMVDYRGKFVEANAEALAAVQHDNISSITTANEKIAELAVGMKKFSKDIAMVLSMLEGDIKKGLEDQANHSEDFHDKMDMLFEGKLDAYNVKLKEYNERFSELSSRIQEVIEACENNTSQYEQTLKLILDSQNAANSLNNEDIELLKSIMKR